MVRKKRLFCDTPSHCLLFRRMESLLGRRGFFWWNKARQGSCALPVVGGFLCVSLISCTQSKVLISVFDLCLLSLQFSSSLCSKGEGDREVGEHPSNAWLGDAVRALNWGVLLLKHHIWIPVYKQHGKERKTHIPNCVMGLSMLENYCSVIRMKQSSRSHIAENESMFAFQ